MLPLLAALARAADVPVLDGQTWRPPFDATATSWTEASGVGPDGSGGAAAWMSYAYRPLRVRDDLTGDRVALLSDLWQTDLTGHAAWNGLRLGASLPLIGYAASQITADGAGIGDAALDLKWGVSDPAEAPLGAALGGKLFLPTASLIAPVGIRSTGWELYSVLEHHRGAFGVLGNVGLRGLPRTAWGEMVWNDQVFGRAAGTWMPRTDLGASVEWALQTQFSPRENPAGTASELLAGGLWKPRGDISVRGAAGVGLSAAPGTAGFRLLGSVAWVPDPHRDRDLDGLADRVDRCPMAAEDRDGFEDDDGCADRATPISVRLTDAAGDLVPGLIVRVEGPEKRRWAGGDLQDELHPGAYRLIAEAPGYDPLIRDLIVPEAGAVRLLDTLAARIGTVAVRAVDTAGRPLPATVSISGAPPVPADGRALPLSVGEHALVVAAPGHLAASASLDIQLGDAREWTAVLGLLPAHVSVPRRQSADEVGSATADAAR
jgi:hypothetical protein